ncbi:dynactin subunit 4 [Ischnura elegans]|uniref:dynactin subunit 4 n=1 Tax=Ischnura elegans TaxID=197161 RepID=UPI001ED8B55F|nr:dynactin subunit 4 [Ischnura elegans]
MTTLFEPDIVRYGCSCGALKPIHRLYFCRHCLKIRCVYCVYHEVDAHYCSNCQENSAATEARLKKNRCPTCYDCPSCLSNVSTRLTPVTGPSPDNPNISVARKAYYRSCGFCRWSSRDAGLPDQFVASRGWPEPETPEAARVNTIIDHYKMVAAIEEKERQERERKSYAPRRSYLNFSDKFGLAAILARKRPGASPLTSLTSGRAREEQAILASMQQTLAPSEATDQVEELPPEIFTEAPDLNCITTMMQRLAHPEFQPAITSKLLPRHKHLLVKRSLRCRTCEHNVCKPEYNPSSIKFKIQLAAFYMVPEIRIVKCVAPMREEGGTDVDGKLIVLLVNPTQHQMKVQFLPLPTAEEEEEEMEREVEEKKREYEAQQLQKAEEMSGPASISSSGPSSLTLSMPLQGKMGTIKFPARLQEANIVADPVVPPSAVLLSPRDDAAEFDDSTDNHGINDDPKVVVWRKTNKVSIRMGLKSRKDENNIPLSDENGHVGFILQYEYLKTMTSVDLKEVQKVTLKVKVFLNISKAQSE